MYCNTCGREVAPNARFCDNCGSVIERQDNEPQNEPQNEPGYAPGTPNQGGMSYGTAGTVPNYLTQSIVATVLSLVCCGIIGSIPGIVAIVNASKVNTQLAGGDYAGAVNSSNNAKTWSWVAIGLGIFGALIYLVIFAFIVLAGTISGLQ